MELLSTGELEKIKRARNSFRNKFETQVNLLTDNIAIGFGLRDGKLTLSIVCQFRNYDLTAISKQEEIRTLLGDFFIFEDTTYPLDIKFSSIPELKYPRRARIEKQTLHGVCEFHSETGTEGGYWAFQDERFITKDVPTPYCRKCGKWLDPQKYQNIKVERVEPFAEGNLPECVEGYHERGIYDSWSYEGLHILKDGDYLTIYDRDDNEKIVWEGHIKLQQHGLFKEHENGFWIHADQKGVSRRTWFAWFNERYPAKLKFSSEDQ